MARYRAAARMCSKCGKVEKQFLLEGIEVCAPCAIRELKVLPQQRLIDNLISKAMEVVHNYVNGSTKSMGADIGRLFEQIREFEYWTTQSSWHVDDIKYQGRRMGLLLSDEDCQRILARFVIRDDSSEDFERMAAVIQQYMEEKYE